MTAEEVEKYITQIAFSGAEDFVKKYESEDKDAGIGRGGVLFLFYGSVFSRNSNTILRKKSEARVLAL